MLSAQATDVSVNKATDKLYPVANTAQAILALGVDGLKHISKPSGCIIPKAENVIKTCQILVDQHQGQLPQTRKEPKPCRVWVVNRECGIEYCIWSTDHGGRYAYFPSW